MSKGRRHESLIPLSREHHYGLLVCLRIQRGMQKYRTDSNWLSDRAEKAIRFFEADLRSHFAAEEEIVFPAMGKIPEARTVVDELIEEHGRIAKLVQMLRKSRGVELASLLQEFADLLEAHIRKEEGVLFPCYERNITSTNALQVKVQVLERIGSAIKPKHPELLE